MGLTVADDPIGNPFAAIVQDAEGRCDDGVGTPIAVEMPVVVDSSTFQCGPSVRRFPSVPR